MTRVGWLADSIEQSGGAEMTQAEFATAAPDGVDVHYLAPGKVEDGFDLYVVHNCVRYSAADLEPIKGAPTVKYWHDVGPWVDPAARRLLDEHARPVCCSPLQRDYMGLEGAALVPPPLDVARFEAAAARVNGDRAGAVCVASWRNLGKGAREVAEWAARAGVEVDFYGAGPFAPQGAKAMAHRGMPGLLAKYRTFVFLPTSLEPFGRCVAEAWAAGCEVVTNGLVGARYWIEKDPDALETAAEDFWRLVLS